MLQRVSWDRKGIMTKLLQWARGESGNSIGFGNLVPRELAGPWSECHWCHVDILVSGDVIRFSFFGEKHVNMQTKLAVLVNAWEAIPTLPHEPLPAH